MVASPISIHKFRAGFAAEVVPFTPETSFTDVFLSRKPDLTALEQVRVEDGRMTPRVNERGGVSIEGTFNAQTQVGMYLTGKDEATADTVQVAESDLMTVLNLHFGGLKRGTQSFAKVAGTHTSTSVEVNVNTGWAVGDVIGVIDADDTTNTVKVGGKVTDITGDVLTFEKDVGFTIADNDVVVAAATLYYDPDVTQSRDATLQLATWAFDSGVDDEAVVRLSGCAHQLSIAGLAENELIEAVFDLIAANVLNSGRDSLTATLAGTPSGDTPITMGPRTKLWLQNRGTATETPALHCSNLTIDPGLVITRGKTVTSQADGAQGQWGYSHTAPVSPRFEMNITPHDSQWDIRQEAGTFQSVIVWREGTEGNVIAFGMPRAELIVTPKLIDENDVHGTMVALLGHEDLDAIGTTHLAKTPFWIALL